MMFTVTSTVSVGSRTSKVQRHSSMVTTSGGTIFFRKKDKAKGKETQAAKNGDSKKDMAMYNEQIRHEKSIPSRSHLLFTLSDLSPLDVDGSEAAQTLNSTPTDR